MIKMCRQGYRKLDKKRSFHFLIHRESISNIPVYLRIKERSSWNPYSDKCEIARYLLEALKLIRSIE